MSASPVSKPAAQQMSRSTGGEPRPAPSTRATPPAPARTVSGNIDYSPWLGGSNAPDQESLVFLAQAGSAFGVTPQSGDSSVSVTSSFGPAQTVPGGDTITFSGSEITVTIDGESGTSSADDFIIMDNSVEYISSGGLDGTTVNFSGTSVIRDVNAFGGVNTFNIESAGTGGPYNLAGGAGINSFSFAGSSALFGTITGGGLSSLDYAGYGSGVQVNLGNGTNGIGTGVSARSRESMPSSAAHLATA